MKWVFPRFGALFDDFSWLHSFPGNGHISRAFSLGSTRLGRWAAPHALFFGADGGPATRRLMGWPTFQGPMPVSSPSTGRGGVLFFFLFFFAFLLEPEEWEMNPAESLISFLGMTAVQISGGLQEKRCVAVCGGERIHWRSRGWLCQESS